MRTLNTTLDALDNLLDTQAQAVCDGDADALVPLSTVLNSLLAELRTAADRAPSRGHQARVLALHRRARANLEMLNRRQLDVQHSLDALGHGNDLLQDAQANRLYASAGMMAAPAWRTRASAQA